MPTDLFGRTTSYGLGTDGTFTYVWSDRDTGYVVASDSLFHVDGSQIVIPDPAGFDWDSYIISTPTPAKSGSASFDIYLPTLPTNSDFFAPVLLHLAWSDVFPFGFYQEVMLGIDLWTLTSDPDNATVVFGAYNGAFDYDTVGNRIPNKLFPVELGNWYTAKISYSITGAGNDWIVVAGYKLWKRSDPEPDDYLYVHDANSNWTAFGNTYGDGYDGKPWLEFLYTGTVETYADNLTFDSTAPTDLYRSRPLDAVVKATGSNSLSLDAYIETTVGEHNGSRTLDAVIKATRTGSLTLDARFLQALHSVNLDATIAASRSGSFLLDALLAPLHFTIDAFITDNGVLRHFRDRDHTGTLLDTAVVLDQTVGPWQAGTTLRDILVDLWAWVEKRLE